MNALRSLLVTALAVTAVLIAGCGPFADPGGGSSWPDPPEFDPAPGEYSEYVDVQIHGDGRIYVSNDPDASYLDFEPWWHEPVFVKDELYIRAFVLGESGLRSAISEATYTINDPNAPVIASNGVHQDMSNTGPFPFGFWWDVTFPEDGDPNPSDDLTDWYELEVAVFSSLEDNITTIEQAEANGSIIRDWSPVTDSYAYCDTSRAGERCYINVFVRDQQDNVAAYGSVRMQSAKWVRSPDVYLARLAPPAPPNDEVWLAPFDLWFDPGYAVASNLTPAVLENTYAVALVDLNDDGFDDLVACYESGGVVHHGWFPALGNGSFAEVPAHDLEWADPAYIAYDVAIVDMDQDGSPELIFGSSGTDIFVYEPDMTVLMTVPTTSTDVIAVGDVNNEG